MAAEVEEFDEFADEEITNGQKENGEESGQGWRDEVKGLLTEVEKR